MMRQLLRSLARANMERRGFKRINRHFSRHWRDFAYIPSDGELAKCRARRRPK